MEFRIEDAEWEGESSVGRKWPCFCTRIFTSVKNYLRIFLLHMSVMISNACNDHEISLNL
jgi:hypothetical protein